MRRHARIAILGGGLLATVVLAIACGYIALPGGWIVNFPGFSGPEIAEGQLGARIALPPGFSVTAYARDVPNARMLLFTEGGDLLVSQPRAGQVMLLGHDRDGDGAADAQRVLLDHLYQPHGLAYRDGWLYVAETTAVLRVRFDPAAGTVIGAPERIVQDLPDAGSHWTRTVHIGPDGRLYVTVGSHCNVCLERDPRRAAMLRFDRDGGHPEIYATGLRNAVDFAWQPGTNALYATENGRDLLGDDFPPDELNRIVERGFYGWPFANGDRVPDPNFGAGHDTEIAASIPPAHAFPAHVATLGMAFYSVPAGAAPAAFPERYRGAAFVAEHGSWNRSKKIGYQVVALHFSDGTITEEPFMTGFLHDESVSGRPVGVAVGPDAALYVSDDFTGMVYRIAYGTRTAPAPATAPATAVRAQPVAATPDAAARDRGRALWESHACGACHTPGMAPPNAVRPLGGLAARYTVQSLSDFLRTPQPPMPAFPLTDAERADLASYLLATHP
jgi:glucose/arabinose dehydrogenase